MKCIMRAPSPEEEKRKAVCLEQLAADRQNLLIRWPFIGGIILRMELIPVRDDRLQTACTDGNSIFVDVNFYSRLTKDERLFVLAHEVWHCVLLHFMRKGTREHERFNVAADLEIHFTLKHESMREPFVLPFEPGWETLSAEEIYEKIEVIPGPVRGPKLKKNTAAKAERWEKKSFDRHFYQGEQAIPEPGEIVDAGKDGGTGETGEDGAIVIDRDFTPGRICENTVEHIRGRVIASVQQVERMQGKLPADLKKVLDRLQNSSLPWQELLKQFVTSCYGGKRRWLPPARRHVWQELYLPSMRNEFIRVVVAVDTSGSTIGLLDSFFGEVVSLMRSFGRFELTLIQCDAQVQSVEHFSEFSLPVTGQPWKIRGLGGTDFVPVFDYVRKQKERPDVLLFFTDGFGTAPDSAPDYPVMWIIADQGQVPCDWGKKVFLKKST